MPLSGPDQPVGGVAEEVYRRMGKCHDRPLRQLLRRLLERLMQRRADDIEFVQELSLEVERAIILYLHLDSLQYDERRELLVELVNLLPLPPEPLLREAVRYPHRDRVVGHRDEVVAQLHRPLRHALDLLRSVAPDAVHLDVSLNLIQAHQGGEVPSLRGLDLALVFPELGRDVLKPEPGEDLLLSRPGQPCVRLRLEE